MDDGVVEAFRAERRSAARTSSIIAGVVAVVGLPFWGIFDRILVPDEAARFLAVRCAFAAAIAIIWLALRTERFGARHPEQLSFTMAACVQIAIAWMVPRVGDDVEPYLLGMTLAIYASAFLLVWRWQLTALLVALTGAATAVSILAAPQDMTGAQLATAAFYISTAGALAIAAQVYRGRSDWERFVAQAALAAERDRNVELVAELDALSREDPLTGVGNRRAWEERLEDELRRARRFETPLSVIVGDLDHFKTVNDTLGHAAGDRVLRAALELVTRRVRSTDFVARLGGDEFCVVCPNTGLVDAEALATDLVQRAAQSTWPHDAGVTFSLGVAEARPGELDALELLQRADRALYEAKAIRSAVRVG